MRLHVLVNGDVQGVGFRYSTQRYAVSIGVTGWVRNLSDGQVEVLAEGEKSQLEDMLAWLQHGPSGAHVSSIEHEFSDEPAQFDRFSIASTY
ncbi:MAG: acylphosphatase [Candidatus Sigynarchaeota archaeon]